MDGRIEDRSSTRERFLDTAGKANITSTVKDMGELMFRTAGKTKLRTIEIGLGMALLGLVTTMVPSAAFASSDKGTCQTGAGQVIKHDQKLCAGLRYYDGKTLTLIVPTSAGSELDVSSRISAPILSKYLRATVSVADFPSGGSVPGQDALARSGRSGLTFGILETAADAANILGNKPALNFNPAKEDYIGSWPSPDTLLCEQNSYNFPTIKSIADASKGKAVTDATQLSSQTSLTLRLLAATFGMNINYIVGYENSTSLLSGFLRGDAELVFNSIGATAPLAVASKCRPVMVIQPVPQASEFYSFLKSTPTLAQVLQSDPPKTTLQKTALKGLNAFANLQAFPTVAPANTPINYLTALRAAFAYSQSRPWLIGQYNKFGYPNGWVSGQVAQNSYLNLFKVAKTLVRFWGNAA